MVACPRSNEPLIGGAFCAGDRSTGAQRQGLYQDGSHVSEQLAQLAPNSERPTAISHFVEAVSSQVLDEVICADDEHPYDVPNWVLQL